MLYTASDHCQKHWGKNLKKKFEKKNFEKNFEKKKKKFFWIFFSNFFFKFFFHIIRDSGFSLRYAKVRLSFPRKYDRKASFDIHLKWLLGADQKILFTFSNPALKSALYLCWCNLIVWQTFLVETTVFFLIVIWILCNVFHCALNPSDTERNLWCFLRSSFSWKHITEIERRVHCCR